MCIFCDIIEDNIHNFKIYEDETVVAFLDISQVTKGHTLIVPKKHVESIMECDEETLAHMILVTRKIAIHLMGRCHANGMNILSNINEVAGQSVPHFHIHLIPRYQKEDACVIRFEESAPVDLAEVAKQVQFK